MYKSIDIDKFEGLNSTAAPELISDGQARDIMNFRMEKVGKLVSRNGYIFGLFTDERTAGYSYSMATRPEGGGAISAPVPCFLVNGGIIGMCEMTLQDYWEDIDTDKLMVYVIRGEDNIEIDESTASGVHPKRHKECYLFSPLTGKYKNTLIVGGTGTDLDKININTKRTKYAQGYRGSKKDYKDWHEVVLFAPNRYIPTDSWNTQTNNDKWIHHYIDMNQYRHQIIISDRINGDMRLADTYADITEQSCEEKKHQLYLSPNCLDSFDIDIVDLDPRLGKGEKNDEENGVENGMALYKFELQKSVMQVTQDYWRGRISEPDNYPDLTNGDAVVNKIADEIDIPENTDTFISLFKYLPPINRKLKGMPSEAPVYHDIVIKKDTKYVYTNAENTDEYDDLLKEVRLQEEEYINKDGKLAKDYNANVYIWEDYRIKYYPCSGKEITADSSGKVIDYSRYLKEIDREFTKQSGGPKIFRLEPKKNAGKYAPLGVWRYRFVWDFGDGVYSAPSAEIVCPDLLWSAVNDKELMDGTIDISKYQRKKNLKDTDFYKQPVKDSSQYPATTYPLIERHTHPAIFNENDELTKYGEKYFYLKHKVYRDANHKYGVRQYDSPADINAAERLHKGNLGVTLTVFFSERDLTTKGYVYEGVAVAHDNSKFKNMSGFDFLKAVSDNIVIAKGNLAVPIFQTQNRLETHNAVFDDEGRYRLAYLATSPDLAKKMLIFPGHNIGIGTRHIDTSYPAYDQYDYRKVYTYPLDNNPTIAAFNFFTTYYVVFSRYSGNSGYLYLNIVCNNVDENNDSNDLTLRQNRPLTRLRACNSELDRLTWLPANIPAQVIDRLIVSGICGLEIVSYGDTIYFDSTHIKYIRGYGNVHPLGGDYIELLPRDYYRIRTGVRIYHYTTYQNPSEPLQGQLYCHTLYADSDQWNDYYFGEYYRETLPNNIKVIIYGEGERFLGDEQLTAYFPSSLLFGAPRMAIKIPYDEVPAKAKKLLIFRTKSTHSNDYQPTEFGLVDTIDIKRWTDDDTNTYGTSIYAEGDAFSEIDGEDNLHQKGDEQKNLYHGIYYFDDKKDSALDFGVTPLQYEGLRKPLKSRFNIPLNERVYYLNYETEYQPLTPRKSEYEKDDKTPTTDVLVLNSTDDTGFETTKYFYYLYVYIDKNGIRSQYKQTEMVTVEGMPDGKKVVILYLLPTGYDYSVDKIEIYRAKAKDDSGRSIPQSNLNFYLIGTAKHEDEGIFVDNNLLDGAALPCLDPEIYDYESGMMWSEPYRPDWIKMTSFAEYRSGDGMQITGAESLYGNILITKETSAHRIQIQGVIPPITRTDEVTPELGCIAPMTLISVNGIIYYLSWKGFIRYDNNQFQKIDGAFDEELQYILQNNPVEMTRDASCGYNPAFNELYLNIPTLKTKYPADGRQYDYGNGPMYQMSRDNDNPIYYQRALAGHIYVINLEKGYVTKFAYQTSIPDPTTWSQENKVYEKWFKELVDRRQVVRMYYTNSLGELRSADILAAGYNASGYAEPGTSGYNWAGIYIETPYNINEGYLLNGQWYSPRQRAFGITNPSQEVIKLTDYDDFLFAEVIPDVITPAYITKNTFPPVGIYPIKTVFKSKFFTGDRETLIKRVRKVVFNIFSRGGTTIKGISIPRMNEYITGDFDDKTISTTFGTIADERITNLSMGSMFDIAHQTFQFYPSTHVDIIYGRTAPWSWFGIGSNIIAIVPSHPILEDLDKYNDWYGKPIRFSVEVESLLRTQINSINIHWRPIHTYLS